MSRRKVVSLRSGFSALSAFTHGCTRVHAFQRVPYGHDETEPVFMAGRQRAYVGQAYTTSGVRGQTEVRGVNFRDVADAITTELCRSRRQDGQWGDEAVAQNVCILIEKMMGIYPNVPPLEPTKVR